MYADQLSGATLAQGSVPGRLVPWALTPWQEVVGRLHTEPGEQEVSAHSLSTAPLDSHPALETCAPFPTPGPLRLREDQI